MYLLCWHTLFVATSSWGCLGHLSRILWSVPQASARAAILLQDKHRSYLDTFFTFFTLLMLPQQRLPLAAIAVLIMACHKNQAENHEKPSKLPTRMLMGTRPKAATKGITMVSMRALVLLLSSLFVITLMLDLQCIVMQTHSLSPSLCVRHREAYLP